MDTTYISNYCRELGIRFDSVRTRIDFDMDVYRFTDLYGVVEFDIAVSEEELVSAYSIDRLIKCVCEHAAGMIKDWLDEHAEGN